MQGLLVSFQVSTFAPPPFRGRKDALKREPPPTAYVVAFSDTGQSCLSRLRCGADTILPYIAHCVN